MNEIDVGIEYPFIKITQECLIKGFKNHKKFIEKELHGIVTKIQALKKTGGKDKTALMEKMEKLIDQTKELKGKYEEMLEEEDKLIEISRKRVMHLREVELNYKTNQEVEEAYHITRLDRMILDYLLREGYLQSATQYASQLNIQDFADIEVFTETKKIISSLADHNCTDAINWCVLHKTKLAKFKSKMERELRIQEFIGLIGEGKYSEAILYSRKHFQKYFTEHKTKIQKVMMLLAIPRGNTKLLLQYKDLLGEERWTELIKIFLSESYKLHSLTNMSPLTQALQAGLSSVKTIFCKDKETKNEECPTCSELLGELSKCLPYSYHLHSTLVCKISGEIMDENNAPLFLPNGYIYSEKALADMAMQHHGKVICPITKKEYLYKDLKKVFIC